MIFSLRARLLLLVAIAVVPVLGLTLNSAVEQRQAAGLEVQETALRLARIASTQQGQLILGTRQLLTGLAQLREVRQGDRSACSALFADLLKAYPLYSNLGAIDREGRLYCSALSISGSINLADRPYFQRALQSGDFAIGDYQIGRVTKAATLNFGYPIVSGKNTIQGVVFAAVSLGWLNQVIKEADLPEGSIFSVTDKNGTILIRYPDPESWVGRKTPQSVPIDFVRGVGTGVAEAHEPDGIPRLVGFTPLLGSKEAGDVYVSIGIPKRAAFAEADRALRRNLLWLAVIATIAFAAAWFGGDLFILRQVNAVVESARHLEKGELTKRVGPPYGRGELGRLARAFDDMAASLQKHALRLHYQATRDTLTGLVNRDFFKEHLDSEILTARETRRSLALLLMDLDHFKEINDAIGHQNGDRLLKKVTQRLKHIVRKSGVVARLGGDEFSVVVLHADVGSARASARNILKAFEEPFVLDELIIAVELSLGIALYPEHGEDADLLIRRAEVAMYLAKEGKTGCEVYVPEKDQYSPERLILLAELRRAIDQNQLYLLYQPKLDLRTRAVSGVEALVRWQHPRLGMVAPDQFIGLAERTALMKPLTFWVLGEALRQCVAWHRSGLKLSIAVNISARNLEADFPDEIKGMLHSHQLAPQWLELEITEGAIMREPIHAREILTRLGECGIKLSIDDFGTGYSSLAYLSRLPVDQIKIDKSFVMNMAAEEGAAAIVRSTIELGHELGLNVVAEGVETEDVLEKLAALGCDTAQGYHISRPVRAPDLTEWLKQRPATLLPARHQL